MEGTQENRRWTKGCGGELNDAGKERENQKVLKEGNEAVSELWGMLKQSGCHLEMFPFEVFEKCV